MEDKLLSWLRSHLAVSTSTTPGAAASVALFRGGALWARVITASADTTGERARTDSHFPIYSLTKSFTAVVILRLVDSGALALDVPLSRWLPGAPNADRITIRQCLQHTSGLPDYGSLSDYHEAVRRGATPWTVEEFEERADAQRLRFEPGRGWGYSNIGYLLLRCLIEQVSGQSFGDMIAREVTGPLGLRDTTMIRDQADLRRLTPGSSASLSADGLPVDVRERYDPAWVAPGTLASTASDVACFYRGLFAGELLPSALLEEMCTLVRAAPSHPRYVTPSYGLGLMADPDSPHGPMYGHNGGGPGYAAWALHFRTRTPEPVTVAVLLNTEDPEAAEAMVLAAGDALAARPRPRN